MKCYDCELTGTNENAAIGLCCRCNLVVCTEHGRVTHPVIHRTNGTGKSTSDRPARRMVCHTCHGAERSA